MSRMPCCWPAGWSSTIEHTVIENRVAVTNGNRFREYLVPDLGALNADGLCGRVDGSSLIKRLLCTDSRRLFFDHSEILQRLVYGGPGELA